MNRHRAGWSDQDAIWSPIDKRYSNDPHDRQKIPNVVASVMDSMGIQLITVKDGELIRAIAERLDWPNEGARTRYRLMARLGENPGRFSKIKIGGTVSFKLNGIEACQT